MGRKHTIINEQGVFGDPHMTAAIDQVKAHILESVKDDPFFFVCTFDGKGGGIAASNIPNFLMPTAIIRILMMTEELMERQDDEGKERN